MSRDHPDAGLTSYAYDLAGNLTSLTTANLREGSGPVVYQYEYERLTDILYPDNSENDVHYVYGEAGAKHHRAGRIVMQEDASGAQEFFYGPLGEVIKNVRTVVIPQFEEQTYTTEWQYDTWNRLTQMSYPDGETVEYRYNTGGLLHSMKGKKQGDKYDYVQQLGYDEFEQRVYLEYGNGTKTHYAYEPERRRLSNMTASTAAGRAMMDNVYGYDQVNNILSLKNQAEIPSSNLMGGSSEYRYEYDELYRLTQAEGHYRGSNEEHRYSLSMQYNSVGGIEHKRQIHERKGGDDGGSWNLRKKSSYEMAYEYGDTQPHAPIHIGEQKYSYDKNGNQTGWTHDVSGQRRQIVWDEENRIRAIADNGSVQHYVYDASGTRVLKGKSKGQSIRINSEWKAGSGNMGNYTVYVNPYLVLRSGGYTKHYYIEGQRIVSKLGSGLDNQGKGPLKAGNDKVNYGKKQQDSREGIVKNLKWLGVDGALLTAGNSGKTPPGQLKKAGKGDNNGGTGKGKNKGEGSEKFQYFYHPDHLGSSSYITDASGEVYQHLEYFAFGETFVEEHSNTKRTPYLFNGKELDEETGLYYYGARYYDAQTSVWLSVDPLYHLDPAWSPYNFSLNNPVNLVDPDGRSTHTDVDGNVVAVYDDKNVGVYKHDDLSSWDRKSVLKTTGDGITNMGETEHWDEFVSPETGKTMTNYRIQFGKSFDPIIDRVHSKAEDMNLVEIAMESRGGGEFDIKKDYENVGGLLNGKYATSRSAGNFLAGYNAEGGTYKGFGISFETFQKLAGALHIEESNDRSLSKGQMVDIAVLGFYSSSDRSKFKAPTWGEVNYQYRMSKAGWNYGKKK